MNPNTKFIFWWRDKDKVEVSPVYDFLDDDFYANKDFVEKYYGVKAKTEVLE